MTTIFLWTVGILILIAFIIIVIVRRQSKKIQQSRRAVENFLGSLYESFYNAHTKYVSNYSGPKRSREDIASDIARDIADLLGSKLDALMSNISTFPKEQRELFGRNDTSNHFIDNMIPNLAFLCKQYNRQTDKSSFDGKAILFRIAKIKVLEILKYY